MLHLLASTILMVNAGLLYHLSNTGFVHSPNVTEIGKIKVSLHGTETNAAVDSSQGRGPWAAHQDESVTAACAGPDLDAGDSHAQITNSLTRSYLEWRREILKKTSEGSKTTLGHHLTYSQTFLRRSDAEKWRPPAAHYADTIASCILIDKEHEVIWAVGDLAGAVPLWYAITDREPAILATSPMDTIESESGKDLEVSITLTSDLAAAQRMIQEMQQNIPHVIPSRVPLGPLGPAQLLCIALDSGDILSIHRWHRSTLLSHGSVTHKPKVSVPMEAQSRLLLTRAASAAGNSFARSVDVQGVLLEHDPISAPALLMECSASNNLTFSTTRKRTMKVFTLAAPSLLTDGAIPTVGATNAPARIFMKIMQNLTTYSTTDVNYATGGSGTIVKGDLPEGGISYPATSTEKEMLAKAEQSPSVPWQPSVLRIAASRFTLCQNAAEKGIALMDTVSSGVMQPVMSTSAHPMYTPLKAYYTSLFCHALGVPVLRPYSSLELQRLIQQDDTGHISSGTGAGARLRLSLSILQRTRICFSTNADSQPDLQNLYDDIGSYTRRISWPAQENEPILIPPASFLPTTSSYYNLLNTASKHATSKARIVVVLATEGYIDMLSNFLCSLLGVHNLTNRGASKDQCASNETECAAAGLLPVLVVTPSATVAAVAADAGAGAYLTNTADFSRSVFYHTLSATESETSSVKEAVFGSLSYQRLMLIRTQLVWELLCAGLAPIVADIDTVWLKNPLEILEDKTRSRNIDVAYVLDRGPDASAGGSTTEVCGCFVALSNTPSATAFWSAVLEQHEKLLQAWGNANTTAGTGATGGNNGQEQGSFSVASEQKIITDLLTMQSLLNPTKVDHSTGIITPPQPYKRASSFTLRTGVSLRVVQLPSHHFPSGYEFFNKLSGTIPHPECRRCKDSSGNASDIAVIHNNFILSRAAKVARFKRYGLWLFDRPISGQKGMTWSERFCKAPGTPGDVSSKGTWKGYLDVDFNLIPTLEVVSPVHQTLVPAHTGSLGANVDSVRVTHMQMTEALPVLPKTGDVGGDGHAQSNRVSLRLGTRGGRNVIAIIQDFSLVQFDHELEHDPVASAFGNLVSVSAGNDNGEEKSTQKNAAYYRLKRPLISSAFDGFPGIAADIDIYPVGNNEASKACDHATLHTGEYIWKKKNEHARRWNSLWHDERTQEANIEVSSKSTERKTRTVRNRQNKPRLKFRIVVLAYNRPEALERLLESLIMADYSDVIEIGDKVDLEIITDGARYPVLQNSTQGGNTGGAEYDDIHNEAAQTEARQHERTKDKANEFKWPYGSYKHTARPYNYGLPNMWLHAWKPKELHNSEEMTRNGTPDKKKHTGTDSKLPSGQQEQEMELTFVFEDDMYVSPYFFQWAYKAAYTYYAESLEEYETHEPETESRPLSQIQLHRRLLHAVEQDIEVDLLRNDNKSTVAHITEFTQKYVDSGEYPLLYGICLQKQHVNGARYPRPAAVRNGNMPFLYELIGSWGPLLFPIPWKAFTKWVSHINRPGADKVEPVTARPSIVNTFYYDSKRRQLASKANESRATSKENHILHSRSLWTPWMVLFSTLSHSSCLYPNLPKNLSLVTNFQEKGMNYEFSVGPDSEPLSAKHFMSSGGGGGGGSARIRDSETFEILLEKFKSAQSKSLPAVYAHRAATASTLDYLLELQRTLSRSFHYMPPPDRLLEWQYDISLQRLGAAGSDGDNYCRLLHTQYDEGHDNGKGVLESLLPKCLSHDAENPYELCTYILSLRNASSLAEKSMQVSPRLDTETQMLFKSISLDHWNAVLDMVEARISPFASVVHIGMTLSPLLLMLVSRYWIHKVELLPLPIVTSTSVELDASLGQCVYLHQLNIDRGDARITCKSATLSSPTQGQQSAANGSLAETESIAVITQTQLDAFATENGHLVKNLWQNIQHINYVLVLGACHSAPTVLYLPLQAPPESPPVVMESDQGANEDYFFVKRFHILEDVCTEGLPHDVGALLYSAVDWVYLPDGADMVSPARAVTKRLRGGLITRTVDFVNED